jgi:hypothetical protein
MRCKIEARFHRDFIEVDGDRVVVGLTSKQVRAGQSQQRTDKESWLSTSMSLSPRSGWLKDLKTRGRIIEITK